MNASGKTFTVRSSLQLHVDRNDDGVAYTCKVDHVALTQTPQEATEVLEVHCECTHKDMHSLIHMECTCGQKYMKEEVSKCPLKRVYGIQASKTHIWGSLYNSVMFWS